MLVFALAFCHSLGSIIMTLLVWWKVDVQSGGYCGKALYYGANYLWNMTSVFYFGFMMKTRFMEAGRFAA